jgi:hypothetical protein
MTQHASSSPTPQATKTSSSPWRVKEVEQICTDFWVGWLCAVRLQDLGPCFLMGTMDEGIFLLHLGYCED